MSIAFDSELDTAWDELHLATLERAQTEALVTLRVPRKVRLKISMDDFERLCQANREARLERSAEGGLILMAPEGSWTGNRNFEISGQLFQWIKTHGGYGFGSSAGFVLPDGSCRSPDASWISPSRWEALTTAEKEGFARVCPDFVVELRSPNDSMEALQAKMAAYLANGAQLGWLIDPVQKIVMVYRPNAVPELLAAPQKISGEAILPGFELDLKPIFAEPA